MRTNGDHGNLIKTGIGVLLLLALLQTETEAQSCPTGAEFVNIDENNAVGVVVTTIAAPDNATLENKSPTLPFRLEGKNLVATASLDFEPIQEEPTYEVKIECTFSEETPEPFTVIVWVQNLNDNPPKFDKPVYTESIPEMTSTVLGPFNAKDPDNIGNLIYTLTSESNAFTLRSEYVPEILVAGTLQYDNIKTIRLTLTVQDTDPATPLHTDSTTIDVTITDEDNRPPWFQPCNETEIQGVIICPNTGYRGIVKLGVLETAPLPLSPNNIWAKDGDNGINEPIKYTIVSGDEGLFEIDADTGNVTLRKAVDMAKNVSMTVMAYQEINTYQFATTTLTMQVDIASDHKPQFEKAKYEAVVEGVGTMAVEAGDKNQALKILATDQDYAINGGINPYIVYSITGSNAFSIIGGFLFMTTEVSAGLHNMEIKAKDTFHTEEVTAPLEVEVVEEPTTTAPPTTVSTLTPEPTTGKTTVPTPSPTVITTNQSPSPSTKPDPTSLTTKPDPTSPSTGPSTLETSNPSSNPTTPSTTGPTVQTSRPASTTEGITAHTGEVIHPPGGFTSADMAALGATLGVLLFICVVVIAALAVKIRKGNSDWRKINEASVFRSSLGPSGQKEGVQFTNEAFKHDDDDKDNKGGPSGGGLANGTVPSKLETNKPQSRSLPRPPSPIQDDEKVKPILSKDKSKEDGYKAVWFKEDIDPNAKEEVVIIPDRRAEEDEDDSEGEMKIPKVKFSDTDRDSGLGDKMDDSDEDRVMTSNL